MKYECNVNILGILMSESGVQLIMSFVTGFVNWHN